MSEELGVVLQLEVAEAVLHELVQHLLGDVLGQVAVVLAPAEPVRHHPRLVTQVRGRELPREEVSVRHVGQLRQVARVDVGGSLAAEVRVPEVFTQVVPAQWRPQYLHSIYTLSTKYVYCNYTVSAQYLHSI